MAEAGTAAAPAPEPAEQPVQWVIAPVVALAAFMEVLDISIANVSLRHIAGDMSASQDESTWILTSYLITNAVILPISGWLSSVMGRKNFFIACIVGFGISSLFCGLAPTLPVLIIFRAIQGITGGGLQPTSQSILADGFPPRLRGMAFAIYGMAVVCAPAIGPTLGGWITDSFSWRWVFLINVPVSVILFFLTRAMVHDPARLIAAREAQKKKGFSVDYIGFSLMAIGLGCLQVMLDKGQEDDWFNSPFILTLAITCVVSLTAWVLWELSIDHPIVDLRLLKNRNFAVGNLLMLSLGFVLLGSTATLPLFVQSLLGYTATTAGLVISPGGVVIVFLMPLIGRLITVFDARYLLLFGFSLGGVSMILMSGFTLQVDYPTIALYRIIQACSLAFLFIPINTAGYVGVPIESFSNASALINLSRNLGGGIGISLLTTVVTRSSQIHREVFTEHTTAASPIYNQTLTSITQNLMAASPNLQSATLKAQAVISNTVDQQASMLSYNNAFIMMAVVFFSLIPVVFLMQRPPKTPSKAPAH